MLMALIFSFKFVKSLIRFFKFVTSLLFKLNMVKEFFFIKKIFRYDISFIDEILNIIEENL